MRVLVTGGCGFIGSNFIKLLFHTFCEESIFEDNLLNKFQRRDGAKLRVMNVDCLTYAGNLNNVSMMEKFEGYEFSKVDIRDSSRISEIFQSFEPEFVVHFAAESHVDRSIDSGNIFVETNVLGTQVLLECSKEVGVKRFIHISTDEVYGSTETGSFSEKDILNPSSPYAASKASSDLMVLSHYKTYETPVIITRCTNNYGKNQHTEKLLPKIITFAKDGESIPIYGDGKNIRDWLHVLDHCSAILLAMEQGIVGEIYNIAAQDERNNLEVLSSVFSVLGKEEKFHFVKDRAGHDWRYSLDDRKIRKLGWSPKIDFDTGIEHIANHY